MPKVIKSTYLYSYCLGILFILGIYLTYKFYISNRYEFMKNPSETDSTSSLPVPISIPIHKPSDYILKSKIPPYPNMSEYIKKSNIPPCDTKTDLLNSSAKKKCKPQKIIKDSECIADISTQSIDTSANANAPSSHPLMPAYNTSNTLKKTFNSCGMTTSQLQKIYDDNPFIYTIPNRFTMSTTITH